MKRYSDKVSIEKNTAKDGDLPYISVVMAVKDEETYIEDCLNGFNEQTYPKNRFEVIIASGSTDSTDEIIRRYIQESAVDLILLPNPSTRTADGLNIAMESAQGDFVAMFIGHSYPSAEYLERMMATMLRSKAKMAGGRAIPIALDGSIRSMGIASALSAPFSVGKNAFTRTKEGYTEYSHWVMISRKTVEETGLVKHYPRGEDYEYVSRINYAGGRCYYDPKIICYYHPRDTYLKLFSQYLRSGYYRVMLFYDTGKCLRTPHTIPAVMVICGAAGFLWGLAGNWLFFTAGLSVYASANAWYAYKQSEMKSRAMVISTMFAILLIHTGYGLGMIFGGIKFTVKKIIGSLKNR